MDGGAWKAAVHGVAEGQKRLSNFTFTFHFHALEKETATHSSVLAWPGGLPSLGSHRVRQDWSDLAAAALLLCLPNFDYGFSSFFLHLLIRVLLLERAIPLFLTFRWCLYSIICISMDSWIFILSYGLLPDAIIIILFLNLAQLWLVGLLQIGSCVL